MSMAKRIDELMHEFMRIPTHTNTVMETNAVSFFKNWYLQQNFLQMDHVECGICEIPKDVHSRSIPWVLVKGKNRSESNGNNGAETAAKPRDTVVLMHHSDTADILDYGIFEEWAYEPEKLEQMLLQATEKGTFKMEPQVVKDFVSGEWLFGRGGCDMKAGAAIEMALVEKYASLAAQGEFDGNLLLLSLPDEENLSAGMRYAPILMEELAKEHNLIYRLMINTEPHDRENADCGTLYAGSVGKLMPVCYVKGVAAHVGQIYQGLNPILLLSEIIRMTEQSPSFIELAGEGLDTEVLTPPVWLCAKDRKNHYDVSLPLAASGYMSVLTLHKTPDQLVEELVEVSRDAFNHVLNHMAQSRTHYQSKTGKTLSSPEFVPDVRTFADLLETAKNQGGTAFMVRFEEVKWAVGKELQNGNINMPEATVRLIEWVLAQTDITQPMVIWALSPPYYPTVSSLDNKMKTEAFDQLISELKWKAMDSWQESYTVKEHFFGICDLSYAMCDFNDSEILSVEANMPLWGETYHIPFEPIRRLSMPVLNIGPWGKDFHKLTERVYKQDVYERTPVLIEEAIRNLFEPKSI